MNIKWDFEFVSEEGFAEFSDIPYDAGLTENTGWLEEMRERAQAIHDGLDFFGFAPEYVPLQAYEQLLLLTEGPTGDTGLLGTARDLEDQARDAQRTFDANASDMATELDNLEVELNGQLFELCGESQDDFETCEGGLMEQNLDALDAANFTDDYLGQFEHGLCFGYGYGVPLAENKSYIHDSLSSSNLGQCLPF